LADEDPESEDAPLDEALEESALGSSLAAFEVEEKAAAGR